MTQTIKYIVNDAEFEMLPGAGGPAMWPQFTTVCAGGLPQMSAPSPGINLNAPIQPIQGTVPQSAYNEVVKLWADTMAENEQLRVRIAELEKEARH